MKLAGQPLREEISPRTTPPRSFQRWIVLARLGLLTLLVLVPIRARATVTDVAWYRLGENDPGALSGQIVNTTTINLLGVNALRRVGSPRYTNGVPASASDRVGSSLAVSFSGGQFYTNALATTARDNFGIEAWVSSTTTVAGTYVIAHNGAPAANGWGLQVTVGGDRLDLTTAYSAELGGGVRIGSGTTRALWNHVALVRENGTNKFFLNGQLSGSSSTATPATPAGGFIIGAIQSGWRGLVDEVRVFTFAAGQFSPSDLLINLRRAVTLPASGLRFGDATLNGSADSAGFPTTTWFEFGTTTNLGTITPPRTMGSAFTTTNFSETLTSLDTNLTFHYRAAGSNRLGAAFGAIQSFNFIPSVITLPAGSLGGSTATLNALANPKGTALTGWFEWGLTTNYGNISLPRALGSSSADTNFSEAITNLFPGGTFHFRASASNTFQTLNGADQTFVTPGGEFADQVIPGTVLVFIQPPEALADGARWALDNGPAQPSGIPETDITPGPHTVRFRALPNWQPQPPVELFVTGGRTSEVTVVFTRIPSFDFRDVPEQHARPGESLAFFATGASNLLLAASANPTPAGPTTFDPATGRFAYTPAPADRLPFSLTFSTGGVAVATSVITPLPDLASEEITINYDRPLPDDESRDYISISESLNPAEVFNDTTNQTLSVDISGKTLVFDATHPANLHRQYSGRDNIKDFRLFADRVIIRSPLLLPQTRIAIHARELRFEGAGLIDTTPAPRRRTPAGAVWDDVPANNLKVGNNGDPGHPGGDADIFVERFHADPTPAIRFVLRGGGGGPAGDGRDGLAEGTFSFLSPNWLQLMGRAGNPVCGSAGGSTVMLYHEERFEGVTEDVCGSRVTARGEPAVRSGFPGAGGRGGRLRSTLNLGAFIEQPGGTAGAKGNDHVGGALSARQFIYRVTNTRVVKNVPTTTNADTVAAKTPGANAPAPLGTNGVPGTVEILPDPSTWLHSFSVRGVVQFAKDAYLDGHTDAARTLLSDYSAYISALQPIVGSVTNLTDAEFAESTSLDQLSLEIGTLLHRIDSNLDFFGNPAGWAPLLSFEANLVAFQREIDQSIPILYLASFLNHAATNLQDSLAASTVAIGKLKAEFEDMIVAYNEAQTAIPRLKLESQTILARIAALRVRLAQLEQALLARAEQNVAEKHKVPFWKKALGVLSVVADLVPVGQPAVGKVGAGLELLTKIDPDHPVSSAAGLTNALDIFKNNADIRNCFSGSSTNAGGTNAPAGQTPEQKAKKKQSLIDFTKCGKFLQGELKQLAAVFKTVQVDKKEVAAELEKLKASDAVFQSAIAELEQLNKDKEQFAADLAAALQAVTTLTSAMAENALATDHFENRVASSLTALDHNALLHAREMERRAKDRLLTFQYFVAKAFQYRVLRPYSGNLHLNRLLDRFQTLLQAGNSHILTQEEFANLKSIYLSELRDTVAQTLTIFNANAPQRALPIQLRLTPDDLLRLNRDGQTTLNLRERGLFPSTHENIRIIDFRTRTLNAHPVGGTVSSFALLFLDYEHLGISRVQSGGTTFLFRHYQAQSINPITWNTVFDAVAGGFSNSQLSPAAQSLLTILLDQPTPGNLLLFSFPAADADIVIHKETQSNNGIDLALDDLTIEVQYEFAAASSARPALDVVVSDQLAPIITLNQPDLNGRRDGQGSFARVFSSGAVVTLQAPARYGERAFDRWIINNVARPAGDSSVSLVMNSALRAEARFGPAPATASAPQITLQPQDRTAVVGSTVSFTTAATGASPLAFRWHKSDLPLLDGGRISGAASATLVLTNIGLADAGIYSVLATNFVGEQISQPATLVVTGPSPVQVAAPPGFVGFTFPTASGFTYTIERKLNLNDPDWTPVDVILGNGSPGQFTRATTAETAFFRLRVE